jgi:hypothetical protein
MRQRDDEIARQCRFALERELRAADRNVLHLAFGERLAVGAIDHPALSHRMTFRLALLRTHVRTQFSSRVADAIGIGPQHAQHKALRDA